MVAGAASRLLPWLLLFAPISTTAASAAAAPERNRSSSSSLKFFGKNAAAGSARNGAQAPISVWSSGWGVDDLAIPGRGGNGDKDDCECFNCLLPKFSCGQFGECNQFDGQCKCPAGFGGLDCLTPLCDSLSDGANRHQRKAGELCECNEGWGGINCNSACQTDQSCANFRLPGWEGSLAAGDDDAIPGDNMTCYKGGDAVVQNFQMCDVTNPAIIRELGKKKPQVTFSCSAGPAAGNQGTLGRSTKGDDDDDDSAGSKTCAFQFWIEQVESFYCALSECDWQTRSTYDANVTEYSCQKIECDCVPGRMLCGEDGSVNIDEFLQQEVKGPGTFACSTGKGCQFKEPAMNELIDTVFGDPYITLTCDSGECLHYTQVPGYQRPERPSNKGWILLSVGGAALVLLLSATIIFFLARTPKHSGGFGSIRLPAEETAKLMSDHVPATLQFSNISYSAGAKPILSSVSGSVKPGQIMAIMGASGAGKSTLLDILGFKLKRGTVGGDIFVNGRRMNAEGDAFKRVVGFVDQEDTLMSTLTVYETVLYSALLRLPRDMSLEAKKFRTLETMQELGILGIKDSRIGEAGRRSISGGEKRRVSIACELVTSPSVLLLDEPTSGLDAFNAFNVVESLVTLARQYNRTVVFTIHQPRSNIVALFDRLVLLAKGRVVYSGEYADCQDYFDSLGHRCPPGFNIADFLIDLTQRAAGEQTSEDRKAANADISSLVGRNGDHADAENGFASGAASSSASLNPQADGAASDGESAGFVHRRSAVTKAKDKAAQLLGTSSPAGSSSWSDELPEKLAALIGSYDRSQVSAAVRAEIAGARAVGHGPATGGGGPWGEQGDRGVTTGYKRASFLTQFRILSGRAFKNLYRNPMLMAGHYLTAMVVALLCAALYHKIGIDLGSFQNRLGLFFFILALFAFSSLTSLGLFANERLLFMRERANGYYSPIAYFLSKVLFDIIPLRLVPSVILGCIVYGLVGLVPNLVEFWKFLLILVLFNLAAASVVLFLSVAVANNGLASLAGSLVMLYNLLFGGLLMNYNQSSLPVRVLMNLSFFHAAFEGLLVNELRTTQLKDHKYGVDIEVPGAVILSTFGFRSQAFWWPDVSLLVGTIVVWLSLSFVVLQVFVRERR